MAVSASSYRAQKQLCELTMDLHEWLSWHSESLTNFTEALKRIDTYATSIRTYRDVAKELGINNKQLETMIAAKAELEFLHKQGTTLLKSIAPIARRLNPDTFVELDKQAEAKAALKEPKKKVGKK